MKRMVGAGVSMAVLSALTTVVLGGTAHAASPSVTYVQTPSAVNSTPQKIAVADCPPGSAVLGGTAEVTGAEGQVVIQAAFPMFNMGAGKHQFVVKAEEDLTGTLKSWSVTAGAYCTSDTVPLYISASSAFDSNPVKNAEIECPPGKKVVGMGGQVTTSDGSEPLPTVGDLPPASVVFHGFEVNQDLTTVTARATEEAGALGGSFAGSWKVTAVAACGFEYAFDGIEYRTAAKFGQGGPLPTEWTARLDLSCNVGKRAMSMGSSIHDDDMGQWYLDRIGRYNALQSSHMVDEAYRNAELGNTMVDVSGFLICI